MDSPVATDEGAPTNSDTFTKLLNEGPQPLEKVRYRVRQDGARKFDLGRTGTVKTYSVWFIEGKHDPETVITNWLEINNTSNLTDFELHQKISRYGDEFRKASSRILGPFNTNAGGDMGKSDEKTCPLCGDDYTGELPAHITNDCSET